VIVETSVAGVARTAAITNQRDAGDVRLVETMREIADAA
jgi:hypothetical protein